MRRLACIAAVSCFAWFVAPARAGSLDPPGAPAPTMKTLDQVETRTPISALPYTISTSGSYYLTKSLTASGPADGISVSAASASIDLNGFTLDGAGVGGRGIYLAAPSGAGHYAVRNGVVTGWFRGIAQFQGGPDLRLEDLVIRSAGSEGVYGFDLLVFRSTINFNGGYGVLANGVSIVRDSRIAGNNAGGLLLSGPRSVVENCIVDGNVGFGIQAGAYSLIHSSVIASTSATGPNDGGGITGTNGVVVSNNSVSGNAGIGVEVGSGSLIADNNVQSNLGAGIHLAVNSRAESNNLVGNGGYGIWATSGGVTVVRNSARANAVNYSVQGTGNVFTVDTSGTSTNPWVNFSF